jgi:hypothetical protein
MTLKLDETWGVITHYDMCATMMDDDDDDDDD